MSEIKSFLFDYRQNVERKIAQLNETYKQAEVHLLKLDALFNAIRVGLRWDETGMPQVNSMLNSVAVEMPVWAPLPKISRVLQKLCDGYLVDGSHPDAIPTIFSWRGYTFVIEPRPAEGDCIVRCNL